MKSLSEAIRQARIDLVNGIVSTDPDAHIAAAVLAHLSAPETVERMALAAYCEMNSVMHQHKKYWRDSKQQNLYRDVVRAAVAALAGEDGR